MRSPTTNTAPCSAGQNGAHTPGPWQRFDDGGLICIVGDDVHTYGAGYADCVWGPQGPGYGLIADCSPSGQAPTAETIANARLIAAAPQMLEALRCLPTEWLRSGVASAPRSDGIRIEMRVVGTTYEAEMTVGDLRAAASAIAAATGEAV